MSVSMNQESHFSIDELFISDTDQRGIIQSGMGAYVKNRSVDGRHYWVFAVILPKQDGYFSMRIKPTSKCFTLIPQLYAKVLQAEKANGMDAGEVFLLKQLKSLGFSTYSDFMKDARWNEKIKHKSILVTRYGTQRVAFKVDEIIEQQQIAVRKFVPGLENAFEILGGTIFGNGQPGLIVDSKILAEHIVLKVKPRAERVA